MSNGVASEWLFLHPSLTLYSWFNRPRASVFPFCAMSFWGFSMQLLFLCLFGAASPVDISCALFLPCIRCVRVQAISLAAGKQFWAKWVDSLPLSHKHRHIDIPFKCIYLFFMEKGIALSKSRERNHSQLGLEKETLFEGYCFGEFPPLEPQQVGLVGLMDHIWLAVHMFLEEHDIGQQLLTLGYNWHLKAIQNLECLHSCYR